MNPPNPVGQPSYPQHQPCVSCEQFTFALLVITAIGGALTAAMGMSSFGLHQHWWEVGLDLERTFSINMMIAGGACALTSLAILSAKSCWYPEEDPIIEPPPEKKIVTPKMEAKTKICLSLTKWVDEGEASERRSRQECSERILTCWDSQSKETLSLKDLNLSSLPIAIVNLKWLKSLDLSGNQLGSFPTKIVTELEKLNRLNLACNQLTSLPEAITEMKPTISLLDNPLSCDIRRSLERNTKENRSYKGPRIVCDNPWLVEKKYLPAIGFKICDAILNNKDYQIFMGVLLDSFAGAPHRLSFIEMVYQTIEAAHNDASFRQTFLAQCKTVSDAPADQKIQKAIFVIFNTNILYALKNGEDLAECARLYLHGVYALEVIASNCFTLSKKVKYTDPIDIYLTFISQLKRPLHLPIDPENTLSYACGDVMQPYLQDIKDPFVSQFVSTLTDPQKYCEILAKNVLWQFKLKEKRADKFPSAAKTPNTPQIPVDFAQITKEVLQELKYSPPFQL
jgi:hypothetical protein